jgi:hypothetical protein
MKKLINTDSDYFWVVVLLLSVVGLITIGVYLCKFFIWLFNC